MFAQTTAMPLFPTYIWCHDLKPEEYEPLNAAMTNRLESWMAASTPPPEGRSWQTDQTLYEHADFQPLLRYVQAAADGIMNFLQVEHDGFELTALWANINPTGVPHRMHAHPNNFLSGVYYVSAPEGGNVITFHDPRPQKNVINPNYSVINEYNAGEIHLTAQVGRLFLFPAWFEHSVPPNTSAEQRISLSFNIMFSNYVQTQSRPKWRGNLRTPLSP